MNDGWVARLLAMSWSWALAGCAAVDTRPAHRAPSLEVFDRGVAAWNDADLEGYLETYAPDAVYVSGGDVLSGWDVVAAHFRERFAEAADMGRLAVSDLDVLWSDGERAFVVGRWALERMGEPEARGVFSVGLERAKGSWFIVSDHSSAE